MATSSSPDDAPAVEDNGPLTVGVVGSARLTDPEDPRCALAREVGQRLGARGWTVVTGGYGGLMDQVSQGAAQAGAVVVGLPMRPWTGLTPNRWNSELRWSEDYPQRLAHLLACDALVVLDGGVGTLAEAAVVWSALQTEPAAPPIVAVGQGWRALLASFADHLVVGQADLVLIRLVERADEVVPAILASRNGQRPGAPRG